jgi:hypothetical protein
VETIERPRLINDLQRLQVEYTDELRKIGEERAALDRREALLRAAITAATQIQDAERVRGSLAVNGLLLEEPAARPSAVESPTAPSTNANSQGKADRVLDVAEEVLREAGTPLHYRNWALMVQTRIHLGDRPEATLASYLSRAVPGRFIRIDRGVYCLPGENVSPEAEAPTPRQKRRRARRRRVSK